MILKDFLFYAFGLPVDDERRPLEEEDQKSVRVESDSVSVFHSLASFSPTKKTIQRFVSRDGFFILLSLSPSFSLSLSLLLFCVSRPFLFHSRYRG